MTVVPHIRTLLPDGSLPADSQAFVSQQVQQEAGQFATDAQAAQAAAEAARDEALAAAAHVIVGAGRPDIAGTLDPDVAARVSAAPSGAVFRSVDGPQGAWEWRKKGATWVCVEGDTGDINIASLLNPNFTVSEVAGGVASVARFGNIVTLSLVVQVAEGAAIIGLGQAAVRTILTLPAGLGSPGGTVSLGPVAINAVYAARAVRIFPDRICVASGSGSWAAGDSIEFYGTLRDAGPWPTTLTL